jgi:hypothetical protein
MRWNLSVATIAAAMLVGTATLAAPGARAQGSCQSLWVERNGNYKQAGYCFRTQRAVAYFGNGGSYIYREADIRFSPGDWAPTQEIRRIERQMVGPV